MGLGGGEGRRKFGGMGLIRGQGVVGGERVELSCVKGHRWIENGLFEVREAVSAQWCGGIRVRGGPQRGFT